MLDYVCLDCKLTKHLIFRSILPELEKCLDDLPNLSKLFVKRKDDMKEKYGKFCINKPKSEYIINEYDAYFNVSIVPSSF